MQVQNSETGWGIQEQSNSNMEHYMQEIERLRQQLAGAQQHAFQLQQQFEQQLWLATQQYEMNMIEYQGTISTLQVDRSQLQCVIMQLTEDKAVLTEEICAQDEQIAQRIATLAQYEQVVADLQDDKSQLQFDVTQLLEDKAVLLEDSRAQEEQFIEKDAALNEYKQVVADLQKALTAATRLPPPYPMAIKPKPWTVPAQNKTFAELLQQLGDLREQCEELQQQSIVQDGRLSEAHNQLAQKESEVETLRGTVVNLQQENQRLKEAQEFQLADSIKVASDLQAALAAASEMYDDLDEKEFEVSALLSTLLNLHQQNLRLGNESQAALDMNHQLGSQIANLQSQAQHLQGMVNDLQQRDVECQQKAMNDQAELTSLNLTVINLRQQNLRLGAESQCVLDTNQQLQNQVADLQSQLQHLQGRVTDFEMQRVEYQQKAMNEQSEVSSLHVALVNLQQQNLQLGAQKQSALDINHQLEDQVADLQGQLLHLQAMVTRFEQQQGECQLKAMNDQSEVSSLHVALVNLQQQNLQLGAQKQSALDINHQLEDQVADLQGQLLHLQAMVTRFEQQQGECQLKAMNDQIKVLWLSFMVISLRQQNLLLGSESQSARTTTQQLEDQVADLQGQLQQPQGVGTNIELQQLRVERDSTTDHDERDSSTDHDDAPGTPDLVAGSFSEVDGRRLQVDPHNSSSSRQVSEDSLATIARPGSRFNRRLLAGTAVVSAAAGLLVRVMRGRNVRI